jgi:hypothetical protein
VGNLWKLLNNYLLRSSLFVAPTKEPSMGSDDSWLDDASDASSDSPAEPAPAAGSACDAEPTVVKTRQSDDEAEEEEEAKKKSEETAASDAAAAAAEVEVARQGITAVSIASPGAPGAQEEAATAAVSSDPPAAATAAADESGYVDFSIKSPWEKMVASVEVAVRRWLSLVGMPPLPGVTGLVTWTISAVINWMCFWPYALLGLSHSRV